jgi:Tfp pilus assembly protein PilN
MQAERINLLPKQLRFNPVTPQSILLTSWGVCIALVLISAGSAFLYLKHCEATYNQLAAAAKTSDLKLQEIQKKAVAANEAQQRITQSRDFLASKVAWTGALKELSLLLPKTVWLSNFSMKNGGDGPYVEITGSASSQDKIASFLNSLEKSFYFRNVSLRKSEKVATITPDLYKFEFEVAIPQLVAGGHLEKAK